MVENLSEALVGQERSEMSRLKIVYRKEGRCFGPQRKLFGRSRE